MSCEKIRNEAELLKIITDTTILKSEAMAK